MVSPSLMYLQGTLDVPTCTTLAGVKMNHFRVRPIRAVNGRVQCYVVEQRTARGVWVELDVQRGHANAMTFAHDYARDYLGDKV